MMHYYRKLVTLFVVQFLLLGKNLVLGQSRDTTLMEVGKTADCLVTGDGSSTHWASTSCVNLRQREEKGIRYQTRFKILYSDSGIYCLYDCEDRKITASIKEDFADLWNEDVVEAFFWTDESMPIYFEYELSPLNYELPILVPNNKGYFLGWRPWHYEGVRKTMHAAHINRQGNQVLSWNAEFFIPYPLLKPLTKVPPKPGTRWRANFYRIDYDDKPSEWSWQAIRTNFHDYERFGTLLFK